MSRPSSWNQDSFTDLDDFYRFYGYPPDVVEWVEATDPKGSGGVHGRAARLLAEDVRR